MARRSASLLRKLGFWLPNEPRFAGGYPCCCGNCYKLQELFFRADSDSLGSNWTEVAGDADIVSSQCQLMASNTLVVCTKSVKANNHRIYGTFSSSTTGDEFRLIVDYVDADNYHYAQVKTGASGHMRLYKRTAGSDTLLAEDTSSPYGTSATVAQLHLCLTSDGELWLQLLTAGFSVYGVLASTTAHGGTQVGFGIATKVGTVNFNWAVISDNSLDTPSPFRDGTYPCACMVCDERTALGSSWCGAQVPPFQRQVDIAGITNTSGVCSATSCANLNGTYYPVLAGKLDWGADPNGCSLYFYIAPLNEAIGGSCGTATWLILEFGFIRVGLFPALPAFGVGLWIKKGTTPVLSGFGIDANTLWYAEDTYTDLADLGCALGSFTLTQTHSLGTTGCENGTATVAAV